MRGGRAVADDLMGRVLGVLKKQLWVLLSNKYFFFSDVFKKLPTD